MLLYFGIVIVIILVGDFSSAESQRDQVCIKQNLNNNVEIQCSDIPLKNELEKANYLITHQTIICSRPNKSVELTTNQTANLQRLVFFHLESCWTFELPENYFKDLVKLESVTLDNLPVMVLHENVFENSSNLIELTLSRLRKLEIVHPRFLGHQNKLDTLSLIESSINADQVRNILLSVYITLKNLYWRKNIKKLLFSLTYFNNFKFENLVLEYNGITNIDFLGYVSTRYLSLKGNPIGKFEALYLTNDQLLSDALRVLDLSDTNIDQIFQDSKTVIFPYLTELILSDNFIEELPDQMETLFPSLKILDLRNNKLTTIPSLDYMLRIKFGRIYLKGNDFHCNCQMNWVQGFDYKQIPDLYCRMPANSNSTKGHAVIHRNTQLNMLCTAPALYLRINDEFHYLNDSIGDGVNDTVKIYRVDIYPGEILNWQCIGDGDPAPRLKWIRHKQTWKSVSPPLERHKTQTIMSNLMISYKDFRNESDWVFTCKASNIAGEAELQLHVTRKSERPIRAKAVMGNLYQNKNRSNKISNPVPFFIIMFSYHYWY